MYVSMCLCVYVRMYVCMYVCMYARMYVVCMCVYVCVCVCMYVCMYVCVCVHIYVARVGEEGEKRSETCPVNIQLPFFIVVCTVFSLRYFLVYLRRL